MVTPVPPSAVDATRHREADRVARLGTILGIWAHPDDDVYLSAGVMRLALENGQRVVCVTATAGEHGTDDPTTWPPNVLAAERRRELGDSFAVLATGQDGRVEHHWLDHEDGRCADVELGQAAGQVDRLIESVRPDTVLTFGSDGMTGHPDHRAVADWVSAALANRSNIVRLDAAVARSWVAQFDGEVDIDTYFDDGFPHVIEDAAVALNVVLTGDLWAIKDAALRAHRTQTAPVIEHLGPHLWNKFSNTESFAVHADGNDPINQQQESSSP